jgi:hypothetical protein
MSTEFPLFWPKIRLGVLQVVEVNKAASVFNH